MPRTRRSVFVSWLLGISFGVLATLSFEALPARQADVRRCPVTGAAAVETPGGARCPGASEAEGAAPSCPGERYPAAGAAAPAAAGFRT